MHDHRASLTEFDTDYVLTIILLVQNLLDLSSTGRKISTPILHRLVPVSTAEGRKLSSAVGKKAFLVAWLL